MWLRNCRQVIARETGQPPEIALDPRDAGARSEPRTRPVFGAFVHAIACPHRRGHGPLWPLRGAISCF